MNETGQPTAGGPGDPGRARVSHAAPVTSAPQPPAARPRVPRTLGDGAGLLAVCLVLYSAVGAAWGLLRPALHGTVGDEGAILFDPAVNVEFTSFISFVIATGLLSSVVALATFILSHRTRGPGMMLWLLVVVTLSALVFHQIGTLSAGLMHPPPEPESLAPGDRISLVPGFLPGVGILAAPFMAALTYWCAALVTPDDEQVPNR